MADGIKTDATGASNVTITSPTGAHLRGRSQAQNGPATIGSNILCEDNKSC
jgi:hypothetical protein